MERIARTPKDAGNVIRRFRQENSLTQTQLGELLHLRQATISKLEAGEPATQVRVLFDTLSALKLEIIIRPRTKAALEDIEELF